MSDAESIGLFIAFFIGFMIVASIIEKIINKHKFRCKKCKTRYTQNDIDWEVISTETDSNGNEYDIVKFYCECHACGKEKTFTKKFCVCRVTRKSTLNGGGYDTKTYDIYESVENYLKVVK